jgi:hypothetical protein
MLSFARLIPTRPAAPGADREHLVHRAATFAAVGLGAAIPALLVLARGKTLAWRDTAALFAPLRPLVHDALRSLRLPLWNPHEGLGVPLFAQMIHGVLHPLTIVGAVVPGIGIDALLVAHIVLAAVGAAWLAQRLGASAPASAVAGFGYGLSGYVLGLTSNLQYLAGAGAAPWMIGALVAAAMGSARALAGAAVLVAVSVLAGDPQWTAVAACLGVALALDARGPRGGLRATAAIALGAGLGAIQLLPTWAFLGETVRSNGLPELERLQWALSPWRLVELVAPGFFSGLPGPVAAPVFQALGGPSQYPAPFLTSVYLGAALLWLALGGARRDRTGRVLAGAALLLGWAALGTALGADQLLRHVPVWSSFRYPEKLVGPVTLCVALLGALGAEQAGAGGSRRAPWIAGGVALAGLLGAALAWAAAGRAPSGVVWPSLARSLAFCAVSVVGLAILLAARSSRRVRPRRAGAAALLVLLESALASPFALHAGAPGAVEPRPLPLLPRTDPPARVAVVSREYVSIGPAGLDDWDRHVAVQSRMASAPFNVPSRLDSVQTYVGLWPRRHTEIGQCLAREFGPAAWAAWRRFGLDHVVVNEAAAHDPAEEAIARAAAAGGVEVLRDDAWHFSVWKVPARPWASFAPAAVAADRSACETLAAILERGGAEIAIEGPPLLAAPAPPGRSPARAGRVLSSSRSDDRLAIVAESDGDAVLVVNEAWWPGWKATIDGTPASVLPADGLVRALRWPAGRHVLEMRYDPPEVRLGWIVSAVAALLTALLAASAETRAAELVRPSPPRRAVPAPSSWWPSWSRRASPRRGEGRTRRRGRR